MTQFENEYELSDGTKRVMVFPIGKYKTAKYPKLNLTREKADAVVKNFQDKVLGETEPFIDSSGRHDESAPAAGWIKNLTIDKFVRNGKVIGDAVYADVDWTSKGEELVRDKQYRYLSPVLAPHVIPETGEKVGPVLRSMSLTNVPVLRMMPAVEASEDSAVDIACSEIVPDESEGVDYWWAAEESQEVPEANEGEQPAASGENEESDEDEIEKIINLMKSAQRAYIRYKQTTPAIRDLMREAIAKAKVAASEDEDYSFAEAILESLSDEGKEMNNMQKLVEYFKLAADADEDAVIAATEERVAEALAAKEAAEAKVAETETVLSEKETALTEAQVALDAAQTELAEVKKESREASIEHRLAEAISAGLIAPADVGDVEHSGWLRELAFSDEALFDKYVESRKGNPAVDLSELGSGENIEKPNDEEGLRPDQILAKRARALAETEDIALGDAQVKVLREDSELAQAYTEYKQSVR